MPSYGGFYTLVFVVFVTVAFGIDDDYTGEYAVHVSGGPTVAENLAKELGYTFHGQVRKPRNIIEIFIFTVQ